MLEEIDDCLRLGIELLFVFCGAEPISFAVVLRSERIGGVDFHIADRAARMPGGGTAEFGVGGIGICVHPALSLVFEAIGSFGGDIAAVVALDNV